MDHRDRGRRAAVRAALVMGGMLLALAAVYIVLQLYAILGRTYQTETAISASMEDTVPLSGIAMFDAVPVSGGGSLGYLVEDGERVTEGTVLAEIYTDPAGWTASSTCSPSRKTRWAATWPCSPPRPAPPCSTCWTSWTPPAIPA